MTPKWNSGASPDAKTTRDSVAFARDAPLRNLELGLDSSDIIRLTGMSLPFTFHRAVTPKLMMRQMLRTRE
uniref:Uncharacterized protein n=1 Tax=Bionectria ochroleuca TaxID=29856 RepID=A0A0B7KB24_BIOOC